MGYDYQIVDDVFGESHDIKYHIVIFLSYALTISSQNASASAKPKLIPCPARGWIEWAASPIKTNDPET